MIFNLILNQIIELTINLNDFSNLNKFIKLIILSVFFRFQVNKY